MRKITSLFIASEENNYRPPILSYKAFIIYGLILLLLRLILGTLPAEGAAVETNTLMNLINQERDKRNLTTLSVHQSLLRAAYEKSQDMIDRDYFSHIDPDGNYVWGKITSAGYTPYKILGENLAIDFSTSEGMIKAWIDSPTHRANLLHPEFVDQGLSALFGDYQDRYTNLTTSLFGTLATYPKPKTEKPKTEAPTITTKPPQIPPPAEPKSLTYTPPQTIPQSSSEPTTTPITESTNVTNKYPNAFTMSRVIFSAFGILLLIILAMDSIIIHQHKELIQRSFSSYHLFGFILIVLVSILIWWW